jgi:hypothetical protein
MRRFCARHSGLSLPAIRQWVRETPQRLEDELGEEEDIFILAASETGISFRIRPPRYHLKIREYLANGDTKTAQRLKEEFFWSIDAAVVHLSELGFQVESRRFSDLSYGIIAKK